MICGFLRVVQRAEKLHGSLARQLSHFVLSKACFKTQPLRWGLREQKKTVQPRTVLGLTQKTFSTQKSDPQKEDRGKQVSIRRNQREETGVSMSQKGNFLYTIIKELFSSSSPNIIYGKALGKCRIHPEVIGVFGEPVKGFGEMSRRGRRQHVSFVAYVNNGLKRIRVKFYIKGSEPGKQGTVHAEVEEVNPGSGQFEFRYIFVEVTPTRSIIVEDNRSQQS
ncbi:mitochondrial import inner membrane translocase subunit Tim21 isoform X2 [Apodemus sylvaticus]|uniref:mitochondrial import inner membrane translocase subunit Tim21 isoform X2 n=1 Tax=Apodemus sylvaticus TaxID=10129 RepID=UPI002243B77C|nr:mitochondrial import inner membrane translocase subunit Tim21 isoform X2 [Apodemus sylvaticus]